MSVWLLVISGLIKLIGCKNIGKITSSYVAASIVSQRLEDKVRESQSNPAVMASTVNLKAYHQQLPWILDQLNCPMTIGLEKKKSSSLAGVLSKCKENLEIFKNKSMSSSSPNHRNRSRPPSQITFVQTISSRSACRLNEPLTSGEGRVGELTAVTSELDTSFELFAVTYVASKFGGFFLAKCGARAWDDRCNL